MRLNTKQTDPLLTSVVKLTDPPRLQGQRHTRRALTAIMFCATVCSARGYEAISDWAQQLSQSMRRRLGCRQRGGRDLVPSRRTLYRFITAVAIDGKTMRGTSKVPRKQTHVLSAVTHDAGRHLT